MSRKRRGYSLIELMVAVAVLSLLLLGGYLMLDMSLRSFQRAVVRHSVQADTQRLAFRLTEDLRRSHYFGVSSLHRGTPFARDAICIGSVRDWHAPAAINLNDGRPAWDGYVLYYCSQPNGQSAPVSRLYRCWLQPPPAQVGAFPFPNLNETAHCPADPAAIAISGGHQMLSDLVEMFRVEDTGRSQWRVTFRLRQRNAISKGAARRDEVLESVVLMKPENTFPVYY